MESSICLASVLIKDGISQFLLTCVMTLCLSKFLCVHFEKLASIEINQKGVKGDFYSKLKNRSRSWLFRLWLLPLPPLYHFEHSLV